MSYLRQNQENWTRFQCAVCLRKETFNGTFMHTVNLKQAEGWSSYKSENSWYDRCPSCTTENLYTPLDLRMHPITKEQYDKFMVNLENTTQGVARGDHLK